MERAWGAPDGGTRGVADESAAGDPVARTACEIRDLDQRPQLVFAYRVGEIVIDRFYDGDVTGWR